MGSRRRGGKSNGSETPMTITEVLDAAVAGGYHIEGSDGVATHYGGANSEYSVWTRTDNHSSFMIPVYQTFLDPAFWHAVGLALGWEAPCALAITCGAGQEECRRSDGAYWMYQWHCFIQHFAGWGTPPTPSLHACPRLSPVKAAGPHGRRSRQSGNDMASDFHASSVVISSRNALLVCDTIMSQK